MPRVGGFIPIQGLPDCYIALSYRQPAFYSQITPVPSHLTAIDSNEMTTFSHQTETISGENFDATAGQTGAERDHLPRHSVRRSLKLSVISGAIASHHQSKVQTLGSLRILKTETGLQKKKPSASFFKLHARFRSLSRRGEFVTCAVGYWRVVNIGSVGCGYRRTSAMHLDR
jgi:hypothetical protein